MKAAKELVDRGFSTADIRKAIDRVRASLPDIDRPLEHLRVAFDGKELVLVEDGAAFALSGQRVFDFGLGELRARATGWGRTTPTPSAEATDTAADTDRRTTPYGWFQRGPAQRARGRRRPGGHRLSPGAEAGSRPGRRAHQPGRGWPTGAATWPRRAASFEAALALDPDQPEARYNLAHLLVEAGEMDVAAAELRRVLQLAPDFADAHFNLATALEALGGRRQARDHLLRFLELTAGQPPTTSGPATHASGLARLAPDAPG